MAQASECWLRTFQEGTREGWNGAGRGASKRAQNLTDEWRPLGVLPRSLRRDPGQRGWGGEEDPASHTSVVHLLD